MAGEVKINNIIFLNCWHLDQNEDYQTTSNVYINLYKEKEELQYNDDVYLRGSFSFQIIYSLFPLPNVNLNISNKQQFNRVTGVI